MSKKLALPKETQEWLDDGEAVTGDAFHDFLSRHAWMQGVYAIKFLQLRSFPRCSIRVV
jgi:hypothetical protein